MNWPMVPFESLYAVPSRNGIYKTKEFHGRGTKIINMGELFGFDFIGPQPMKRVEISAEEIERSGLENGDLLFGRRSLVEEGAGKCSIVDGQTEPTTFESSLIRVRLNADEAVPKFYYYWLKSYIGRSKVKAIVSGTNVKGIRGSDLKNIPVIKPPKEVQRDIVDVLSAYDDLIENNRRRIALLEESARLLYREWFVHLRFPGHEHVKIIDGIPEEWEPITAFDAMEVLSGGTPKTTVPDYWDGGIPFFTPKDATDNPFALITEKYLTEQGVAACSSKLYPKHTIFITARGTVGKLNLAQVPMAVNQSCYALVGIDPFPQFYLYCSLQEAIEQFKGKAGGAVFDAIIRDTFKLISFIRPKTSLINEFTEIVSPTFDQIDCLIMQNIKLKEARDLLLPRLMNGVIEV